MKLEPVYLLAPKRQPKGVPLRRALLCCVASTLFGSFAGFVLHGVVNPGAVSVDYRDSEDPPLACLMGLADPALDQAKLLANVDVFTYLVPRRYPRHKELWDAMSRMADTLLQAEESTVDPASRAKAAQLAMCFEANAGSLGRADLAGKIAGLRRIGRM